MKNGSFYDYLQTILKKDSRIVSTDGDILRNAVIDAALKYDDDLLKTLLQDKKLKEVFYKEVAGTTVFLQSLFIDYIQDKNFLADSYTKFKNKIGLTIDGKFLNERNEVSLVWPFKDCVLEGGQTKEEQKRKEIFFNEILAQDEIDRLFEPKVLTGFKRYSKEAPRGEEVKEIQRDKDGTIRENMIIKGNNLLALHSLKKQFEGKVKLIYIDPPYNTHSVANTFAYNNSFNHSSWLTFMKNRIDIAKHLIKEDGFLIVSIDHEELFYLGVLCDEIFGWENRLGIIAVETNPRGRSDSEFFATSHEYFFVYAKNCEHAKIGNFELTEEQKKVYNLEDGISKYRLLPLRRSGSNSTPDVRPNLCYPIYYDPVSGDIGLNENKNYMKVMPIDSEGNTRVWRIGRESFRKANEEGEIVVKRKGSGFSILMKDRIKTGRKPKTFWSNPLYDASSHGTNLLKKTLGGKLFSYPKSLHLVKDILKITTNKDDIILDFFAGSGTTAHAIDELNHEDSGSRKFILCEQMDYIEEVTSNRVLKSIKTNDSYIFTTLEQLNFTFIKKIQEAKSSKEILSIWEDMKKRAMVDWRLDWKKFDQAIADFKALELDKQKKLLVELLDKNQLYVNLSEINDADFAISDKDKALNKEFYGR